MGHDHHSHAEGGGAAGDQHKTSDKKRVLIAAMLTGGFMVAEVIGGLLTGSLALLADAGHMFTDAIALALAWYAFHLADKPSTGRHTYGYGRVKTLVAYTNGLAIFLVASWICYEAWQRFQAPPPVLGGPMLVVALLGLVVNIAGFLILHEGSRESLNMRGAIVHVLGDLLGSLAAIVAALVIMATGWTPIDPILSVLVAVLILSTAWNLTRAAAHVLLEGSPAGLDRDMITQDLQTSIKGIREIHHVHLWSIDGASNMATLHASLMDGLDAHIAVDAIKHRLLTRHGISHATVEIDFDRRAEDGRPRDQARGASSQPRHLH